jgi:predicted transcriptional regulator with HTH domain
VAKFKYVRKEGVWKLYWMRRDLKWHLYEMPPRAKTLEVLVREVDSDPHGAFFG